MFSQYDIIVVGAGHAGCEAAAAAATLGSKVLVVTMNMQTIAQMSCNPAMGGIAKGQIIREIDALGGLSGIVSDESMIQFRMLNRSKGPAMWSPRTQNDRLEFSLKWRDLLEKNSNIDFWQEMVNSIIVEKGIVKGVRTGMGVFIPAKAVILTSGTFMNGIIHIGEKQFGGGRAGEKASKGITKQLLDLGFKNGRMKTGTPPRIDGRTIDYSKLEIQNGDEKINGFSFENTHKPSSQKNCWIGYTNTEVHDMLKTGFDQSPMFNGRIRGVGPRYCPSIEDKIERFSERERHQLFVEPEGWNTVEVYLNGFSTSLSHEVQYKALRLIPGFENAKMFRPGYAIEYDYFPPTQLNLSLETKITKNLFFAGQINGTTGYEEAACQGLIAGINAHRNCNDEEPFILKRSDAYIGVLIDDLINKGTDEPYRMFTSRAEFRILLRQDNADQRLTPVSNKIGLASDSRMKKVEQKLNEINSIIEFTNNYSVDIDQTNQMLEEIGSKPISQKMKLKKILSRPEVNFDIVSSYSQTVKTFLEKYQAESLTAAEIELKYDGYIQKEREQVEKINRLEEVLLKNDLPYHKMPSLSAEAKEKLSIVKPRTIGQASRISGVSPSDISVLMVYVGR